MAVLEAVLLATVAAAALESLCDFFVRVHAAVVVCTVPSSRGAPFVHGLLVFVDVSLLLRLMLLRMVHGVVVKVSLMRVAERAGDGGGACAGFSVLGVRMVAVGRGCVALVVRGHVARPFVSRGSEKGGRASGAWGVDGGGGGRRKGPDGVSGLANAHTMALNAEPACAHLFAARGDENPGVRQRTGVFVAWSWLPCVVRCLHCSPRRAGLRSPGAGSGVEREHPAGASRRAKLQTRPTRLDPLRMDQPVTRNAPASSCH